MVELMTNINEQISWTAITTQLLPIVGSVGNISSDLHRRVPNEELWEFKALIDTGEDIFAMTITALGAIDELAKQPPKVRALWPEGGHDTEDRLRIWAADPAGHKRPQWTIVAMAASAWCNALEGFLRGISQLSIDTNAINRVRAMFPDAEIDWLSIDAARATISQRIRPSSKVKSKSTKYLEAVFGCQIDPAIVIGVRALVAFRNSITHPERGRSHDEHANYPSSEQWVAWAYAVRALAGTLIRALATRLDERRSTGESIPLFSR